MRRHLSVECSKGNSPNLAMTPCLLSKQENEVYSVLRSPGLQGVHCCLAAIPAKSGLRTKYVLILCLATRRRLVDRSGIGTLLDPARFRRRKRQDQTEGTNSLASFLVNRPVRCAYFTQYEVPTQVLHVGGQC
jgi:hypothetical protein